MEFTFKIQDSLPGFNRTTIDFACTMETDRLKITAWGDTPLAAFNAACRWYAGHHTRKNRVK